MTTPAQSAVRAAEVAQLREQLERVSAEAQIAKLQLEIAQIKKQMPPDVRAKFERDSAARAAQAEIDARRDQMQLSALRYWREREQVAAAATGAAGVAGNATDLWAAHRKAAIPATAPSLATLAADCYRDRGAAHARASGALFTHTE